MRVAYSSGLKASISCRRFTRMARVGVCTRPTESSVSYFRVKARLAFMPTSQSAWERHWALRYSPRYFSPGWMVRKPSAMASSVMEEIHRRWMGFLQPLFS